MASSDSIIARLEAAPELGPLHSTRCLDVSGGCGAKFELVVSSPAFEGMPLLARHRLVQGVLADEMKSIHALTIKAWTPAQFDAAAAKEAAAGGPAKGAGAADAAPAAGAECGAGAGAGAQ